MNFPASPALNDIHSFSGKYWQWNGVFWASIPIPQEVSEPVFPSGTRVLFVQTTAPTGWTKDTTHNDKALRVVSGTAGSGGSTSFSSTFAAGRDSSSVTSSGSVGSTTLSESQIASHQHGIVAGDVWDTSAFVINDNGGDYLVASDNMALGTNCTLRTGRYFSYSTGGNGSHTHSLSMNAHAHTLNIAVQYVDVIIATKD